MRTDWAKSRLIKVNHVNTLEFQLHFHFFTFLYVILALDILMQIQNQSDIFHLLLTQS